VQKYLLGKKVNQEIIVPKTVITKNNMKRTGDSAGRMYPE